MTTYLLTWNPDEKPWTEIEESIEEIRKYGVSSVRWSCGVTKKIVPGDRVYLIKLGKKPRGIIASGITTSDVKEGSHWRKKWNRKQKKALYVNVDFNTIIDADRDEIFSINLLKTGSYRKMNWEPMASGTTIPAAIAVKLERDWARFLKRPSQMLNTLKIQESIGKSVLSVAPAAGEDYGKLEVINRTT